MTFKSPVYNVISVPIEKIEPNTYNPNSVAPPELKLLYDSIKEDGYTMPIVCYYIKEKDRYVIVDGFHRYRIMLIIMIFMSVKMECYQFPLLISLLIIEWLVRLGTIVQEDHIM